MTQSRLEIFEQMARQEPENAMVWYGLASEYLKVERWKDTADALRNVVRLNPDYTAAHQMLGTALASQGLMEEARLAWAEGIKAADRTGAWKARQHMEGLLAGTETKQGTDFCSET